jgi:hypothetical protein
MGLTVGDVIMFSYSTPSKSPYIVCSIRERNQSYIYGCHHSPLQRLHAPEHHRAHHLLPRFTEKRFVHARYLAIDDAKQLMTRHHSWERCRIFYFVDSRVNEQFKRTPVAHGGSFSHPFSRKTRHQKKNAFAFCFYGVQGTALVFDSLAVLGYVVL